MRVVAALILLTLFLVWLQYVAAAEARPADFRAESTAYCLTGRMSDGSYTRLRSAASNRHPLGTKIRVTSRRPGPLGLRRFVIRDRIGYGSELDFWTPSCSYALNRYGRRVVTYRLGW